VFRKRYVQIASLLILSTAILLFLVNTAVYLVLRSELMHDSEVQLKAEIPEVQEIIRDAPGQGTAASMLFTDDKGQNIFFTVFTGTRLISASPTHPVQPNVLRSAASANGFSTVIVQAHPYHILAQTWAWKGVRYTLYIYASVQQTYESLEHVRDLMLFISLFGLIASFGTNLRLANWALRPARATWEAMQHSMVELSHEIQTPLATANAILANREMSEDTRGAIERELNHASELVRDILYLARLQALNGDSRREPVAVSDITEETVARFVPLLLRRNIKLTGQAKIGLYVESTPDKWARLVSILLKNVVDHAATSTAAAWRIDADGRRVRFVVTNVIAGTDPTTSDHGNQRRGFGLQIVERIVQEMRGEFTLRRFDNQVEICVVVPRLMLDHDHKG